jgi:hypothetical protein
MLGIRRLKRPYPSKGRNKKGENFRLRRNGVKAFIEMWKGLRSFSTTFFNRFL